MPRRSSPSASAVLASKSISVNYTTAPINATANSDYTSQTGTLTIAANSSIGTIFIPILNDNFNEVDEAFTVTLSNPINATLSADSVGEVIITDTWQSNITRTLPSGVENLRLIGNNPINGTGNAGNNVLTGNSANNTLAGLAGNDTYVFTANSPFRSGHYQQNYNKEASIPSTFLVRTIQFALISEAVSPTKLLLPAI
jgi:Ca2+-binding RTX toxin-like protein